MSPLLLEAITEALRGAGASVEIISAAVGAYEAWESAKRPRGQRKHADAAARPFGSRQTASALTPATCRAKAGSPG